MDITHGALQVAIALLEGKQQPVRLFRDDK
jgi:hypothetical protein